jgi:hypothetical protein
MAKIEFLPVVGSVEVYINCYSTVREVFLCL